MRVPADDNRATPGRDAGSGGMAPSGLATLLVFLVPVGLLVLALILPSFMFQSDQRIAGNGLGPGFWPRTMLSALALFSAIWIIHDLWATRRRTRLPMMQPPAEDGHYHMGKALVGLVGICAYGWLLPILGFAVATCLFIALWCWFGGTRNLLVVIPITLIGTVGLLWLFMGLALMPLPRGSGVFDGVSIWLLRLVGIY